MLTVPVHSWQTLLARLVERELRVADPALRSWAAPVLERPSLQELYRVYAILRLARAPLPDAEVRNLSAALGFWPL